MAVAKLSARSGVDVSTLLLSSRKWALTFFKMSQS